MIVIGTEECIDCAVCEPERPVDAIIPDTNPAAEKWIAINQKYAEHWSNIPEKRKPTSDADEWAGKDGKLVLLSENPASA